MGPICSHDTPVINPLNAKLNPICHLLELLGAHHIPHVSRIRVNRQSILHNIPEDRRHHLNRGGNLKSCIVLDIVHLYQTRL
jgi:hypothetical protein